MDNNVTTQDASVSTPEGDREEAIAELMDANEWTREEAEAALDDPRNQTLCEVCGWTMGMICPECSKGCGCSTNCSGWRHREFRSADADGEDWEATRAATGYGEEGCECGAYWASNGYGCVCE